MLRPLLVLLTLIPLGLAAPASALAEDDLLEDDDGLYEHETDTDAEEEEEPAPERLQEADDLDAVEEPPLELDTFDDLDEEDDGTDLLGEDAPQDRIGGPGEDTAEIYRAHQEKVQRYVPDEEIIAWEEYLEKYPNSVFRDRIEDRMEALLAGMYEERIDRPGDGRLDADQREIPFAQPLLLENINPSNRAQAGFEWGLPNYMNLFADYEHQLRRDFSVHAGIKRRYTGWSLEVGPRWAFVKSSRTQTIVAAIADIRLNTAPAFTAFRPQLAAGKKFGRLDVQAQAGLEIDTRRNSAPKVIGGANVTYSASDSVAVFGETSVFMKNLAWERGGSFRFNTLSFGMKFLPEVPGTKPKSLEVNFGASVPYSSNYLMYHFGSIMAQANYYL